MAKVVFGFLLGLAVTAFAVEERADGGLILSPEEVRNVERNWYELNYNFLMAIEHIHELTRQLEVLQKAKCI